MKLASAVLGLALLIPLGAIAQDPHAKHHPPRTDIPKSVQAEHRELHTQLELGMQRNDAIGAAARGLATVLHPHFVREEQIALPPLGALQRLVGGQPPGDAELLLAMTDSLEGELPRMLEEHKSIAAAVEKLRTEALAARSEQWVRFAQQLALHAQSEEEVYYPAAVLVGRLLRHERRP